MSGILRQNVASGHQGGVDVTCSKIRVVLM